jgi:Tol biopolymer transport system component
VQKEFAMRSRLSTFQTAGTALLFSLAIAAVSIAPTPAYGEPGETTLASVTPSGKATYNAIYPSVSADGRWVAFMTETVGEALVAEPVAPDWQSYVRDMMGLRTRRIGAGLRGEAANAAVDWPKISADGRYAVFRSKATNLVAGVQDGRQHIFVQDLVTGLTEVVSVSSQGVLSNGDSFVAALNVDGRFIAFMSSGSNLVPGDNNAQYDIFLRDRLLGTTERISVNSSGGPGNGASGGTPSVSQDGRYVSFASDASNLVAGDTNGNTDGFVRDRLLRRTERISVGPNGEQGTADVFFWGTVVLNPTGRYVLFETGAQLTADDLNHSNDVYLRDREPGRTELISGPDWRPYGASYASTPSISDDGRYVAFCSIEPFDPADPAMRDVYVKDRVTGVFAQANVTSAGERVYGECGQAMISGNGRYVAFSDWSLYLLTPEQVAPETQFNIFLHEQTPVMVRYTLWPASLEFGSQVVGSSAKKTFWLRNRSANNLPINKIKVEGADRGMFLVWHRCGSILAVGVSCGLNVVFKPTTVGPKSATLFVAIANTVRTKPLSGEGIR